MTYRNTTNPATLSCWQECRSCHRCELKNTKPQCWDCSGRNDPFYEYAAYRDDECRCSEGIFSVRTKEGRLVQGKFPGNPYEGKVKGLGPLTESEKEWDEYLMKERERRDDPNWNPIEYDAEEYDID